ncbi:MAG: hypothetical protein AAFR98_13465 [Pseudomonadota bacterium]
MPTFWEVVAEFQTLIAGSLATIAAVVTAYVVYKSAKLGVEANQLTRKGLKEQKLAYAKNQLAVDMEQVRRQCTQTASTIKVHVASNAEVTETIKNRCYIDGGSILLDWEFISLFDGDEQKQILRLRSKIRAFNKDIEKTGGAFGALNWQEHLYNQLNSITGFAGSIALIAGTKLPNLRPLK